MSRKDNNIKDFKRALEYYEIIKEGLIGLSEIARINFEEEDMFYDASFDNIYAVYNSLISLLNIYNPSKDLKEKLIDMELKEHNNM